MHARRAPDSQLSPGGVPLSRLVLIASNRSPTTNIVLVDAALIAVARWMKSQCSLVVPDDPPAERARTAHRDRVEQAPGIAPTSRARSIAASPARVSAWKAEGSVAAHGVLARVTGISLYLVAPTPWSPGLLARDGSSRRVAGGDGRPPGAPRWRACGSSSAWPCTCALAPVIASQLAGNALAKVAPGGGAMARRCSTGCSSRPGCPADRLRPDGGEPTHVRGRARAAGVRDPRVHPRRRRAPDRGHGGRPGVFSCSSPRRVLLASTARWPGSALVQRVRNRCGAGRPLHRLPERLLRERDRILGALGPRWKRALVARSGAGRSTTRPCWPRWPRVGSPRAPGSSCSPSAPPRAGPDPAHPGRAGLRRGRAHRDADAGRGRRRRRRARHVRLPAVLYWLPLPLGLVGLALRRAPTRPSAAAGSFRPPAYDDI